MEKFDLKTGFGKYKVFLKKAEYMYGGLAVCMFDAEDGCPFASATVRLNTVMLLKDNEAFLDTNNCPWIEQFVKDNKLAKPTGVYENSGYCRYPLYSFNLERLEEVAAC